MKPKLVIGEIREYQVSQWKTQNIPLVLMRGFLCKAQDAGFELRTQEEILNFVRNYSLHQSKISNPELRRELAAICKHYRQNITSLQDREFRSMQFIAPQNPTTPHRIEFRTDETMISYHKNN